MSSAASQSPRFGYWTTFFIISSITLCALIEAVSERLCLCVYSLVPVLLLLLFHERHIKPGAPIDDW